MPSDPPLKPGIDEKRQENDQMICIKKDPSKHFGGHGQGGEGVAIFELRLACHETHLPTC